MSTKHTPGPWVLEIRKGMGEASSEATVAEIGTSGEYRGGIAYAQSAEHIDGIGRDELIANAHLIAAAPELLEALKWFVANDETNEGDDPLIEHGNRSWNELNAYWIEGKRAAVAAIAKAEGRS